MIGFCACMQAGTDSSGTLGDLSAYSALRDVVTSLITTQQGKSNEAWGLHVWQRMISMWVQSRSHEKQGGCDSALWLLHNKQLTSFSLDSRFLQISSKSSHLSGLTCRPMLAAEQDSVCQAIADNTLSCSQLRIHANQIFIS